MQNLEGHEETLQISEAIKNKNVTSEVLEEGGEMSQKNLETEEMEMEKFEAFKSSRAMKKRHIERSERRAQKRKNGIWCNVPFSQKKFIFN